MAVAVARKSETGILSQIPVIPQKRGKELAQVIRIIIVLKR